jgi:serine/threonine protein kinase
MEEKDTINPLYFNKYKPLRKLGEGTFGKLYKGIDNDN